MSSCWAGRLLEQTCALLLCSLNLEMGETAGLNRANVISHLRLNQKIQSIVAHCAWAGLVCGIKDLVRIE